MEIPGEHPELTPIRLLLVDDDEEDYRILRAVCADISPRHFELRWVADFDAALPVLAEADFDVGLLDYRLGAHTGLELLEAARSLGCQAPLIFLTGVGDFAVDVQAMRAGAADFLTKDEINPIVLERVVRYVLERRRAEREIEKLAAFPRCNPHPVMAFDSAGMLTYCNQATHLLAQSFGRNAPEDILPAEAPEIVARCLRSLRAPTRLRTTIEQRTIAWVFVPIPANQVVHAYATDITKQLDLEEELRLAQRLEAVGQLAAGVAHDFNNALTVVQGHTSLLQQRCQEQPERADPALTEALQQIEHATEHAADIVQQLLVFARKKELRFRPVSLSELVENTVTMLRGVLGEHIELRLELAPELPCVQADTSMLQQALFNLAVNARDAMPQGGVLTVRAQPAAVTRTVSADGETDSSHYVCLTVADTGCGIPPEIQDKVFDPFFTTKEVGKGTGLGLASVYAVVKQHGGWIQVRSRSGHGTGFDVFLPTTPGGVPAETRAASAVQGGSENLLVVEDQDALREILVNVLTAYGYSVASAATGVRALEEWPRHRDRIDLLVTDIKMPGGVLGDELAERLQRDRPGLKVLFISGYSPGIDRAKWRLTEGVNFLPKPFKPERLAQLVRALLDAPTQPPPVKQGAVPLTDSGA